MQEFKINVLSLDMDFEVTVIGAGVIGLCIARKMCKKNFDTVVIEKEKFNLTTQELEQHLFPMTL